VAVEERRWRMGLLYVSLLPVEDVPLYHTCPGGLAARLAAPPSWRCRACRLAAAGPGLVERAADQRVLGRLRVARPEAVVLDGVDPGGRDAAAALSLPEAVEGAAGYRPAIVLEAAGATPPGVLEEALTSAGYVGVVYDYVLHVERPPGGIEVALESLRVAAEHAKVLEIVYPWAPGRRGNEQIVSSIAHRYPHAAVHVVAPEGDDAAYEKAASVVEKLRDRGLNVYLHPDEPGLYGDTRCTRCGETLLSRKPWGLRLHVEPRGPGARASCPRCGAEQPLLACKPRRPRAIHREHVVW